MLPPRPRTSALGSGRFGKGLLSWQRLSPGAALRTRRGLAAGGRSPTDKGLPTKRSQKCFFLAKKPVQQNTQWIRVLYCPGFQASSGGLGTPPPEDKGDTAPSPGPAASSPVADAAGAAICSVARRLRLAVTQ